MKFERNLSSLPSQRRMSSEDAIYSVVGFKEPVAKSKANLFKRYAESVNRSQWLTYSLQVLLNNTYRRSYVPPSVPIVSSGDAAESYEDLKEMMELNIRAFGGRLSEVLREQGLGKLTWHGVDSCTFDFPEIHVKKGLTVHTIRRERHTHDLVKARQHKLPAPDVLKPPFVQSIIKQIPEFIHPHLRIVTGLEVVKDVKFESQEEQLTGFGQFLKGTKQAVTDANNLKNAGIAAAIAAAVGGGAWLASALATAGTVATTAAQVAVLDPALCLGEIVLCGWENE